MYKFALNKIKAISGKQQFYDLLIDGVSQHEQFISEIENNKQYYSEHKTILSYMDHVANLKRILPKKKFRNITPSKENIKEYEFKSEHLRAYVFHLEKTGKIVTLWGYKNSQKKDLKKFRAFKKLYIESLQS